MRKEKIALATCLFMLSWGFLFAAEEQFITIDTEPAQCQVKIYKWTPFEGNKGDLIAEGESPLKTPEDAIKKNRGIVITVETREKGYSNSERALFSPYEFPLGKLAIKLGKEIKPVITKPLVVKPVEEKEQDATELENSVMMKVFPMNRGKSLQQENFSDSDEIVYVTKTGDKYHRGSCSYLRKSKIPMKKKDAINAGYTPCSRCNP